MLVYLLAVENANAKMFQIKQRILFVAKPPKCNAEKCLYAEAMQNEYDDFFKITDLKGVRSSGYIVNFAFYVKAQRDAHILLTRGPRAIRGDNEYEIGKCKCTTKNSQIKNDNLHPFMYSDWRMGWHTNRHSSSTAVTTTSGFGPTWTDNNQRFLD